MLPRRAFWTHASIATLYPPDYQNHAQLFIPTLHHEGLTFKTNQCFISSQRHKHTVNKGKTKKIAKLMVEQHLQFFKQKKSWSIQLTLEHSTPILFD